MITTSRSYLSIPLLFLCFSGATQSVKNAKPFAATPIDYGELTRLGLKDYKINKAFIEVREGKLTRTNNSGSPEIVNGVEIGDGVSYAIKTLDTLLLVSRMFPKNTAFEVVQPSFGKFVIIKPWTFKSSEDSNKGMVSKFSSDTGDKGSSSEFIASAFLASYNFPFKIENNTDPSKDYYILTKAQFAESLKEFEYAKHSWSFGLMLIPIKIRPFATQSGYFDFTSELNLGPSIAYNLNHNWKRDIKTSAVLTLGVTTFNVDSNIVKATLSDYKIAAFSPSLGLLWDFGKFQASIVTGIDFPARAIQKNWVYRNMPWFGFGIGISIFKINGSGEDASGKNTQQKQ
jgi:hypothetical protein